MGRQTKIFNVSMTDITIDEDESTIDPKLVDEIGKKLKINPEWIFDEEGNVERQTEYVYNEIDDPSVSRISQVDDEIKFLLYISKRSGHIICGTFMYNDDQTGGSNTGLVYITKEGVGIVHDFNTDVCDLKKVEKAHTIRTIQLT
jgi:hypothetical protein